MPAARAFDYHNNWFQFWLMQFIRMCVWFRFWNLMNRRNVENILNILCHERETISKRYGSQTLQRVNTPRLFWLLWLLYHTEKFKLFSDIFSAFLHLFQKPSGNKWFPSLFCVTFQGNTALDNHLLDLQILWTDCKTLNFAWSKYQTQARVCSAQEVLQ